MMDDLIMDFLVLPDGYFELDGFGELYLPSVMIIASKLPKFERLEDFPIPPFIAGVKRCTPSKGRVPGRRLGDVVIIDNPFV